MNGAGGVLLADPRAPARRGAPPSFRCKYFFGVRPLFRAVIRAQRRARLGVPVGLVCRRPETRGGPRAVMESPVPQRVGLVLNPS